jgi:tetratricopeptide (TPR) repeat protein
LVSTRLDRDPEIPLAGGETLEPPVVPPALAAKRPELVVRVAQEYPEVVALTAARRYVTAYKLLEKWPEELWEGLGRDFTMLSGFLDYKAEAYADAIEELKRLADDASYVARRPEVLYYLGRSYYANANYTKAVDALERYIRSQSVLGRDILPGG